MTNLGRAIEFSPNRIWLLSVFRHNAVVTSTVMALNACRDTHSPISLPLLWGGGMVMTVWPLILLPAPNPINYTIVYHFMVFRRERLVLGVSY